MEMHGTTICAVKRNGKIAIGGDGQVTMGQSVIMKGSAVKVKRLFNDKVVIGFAGVVADAFALSERLEAMLQKYSGNLMRACVEVAGIWREGKVLKCLDAMLIAADKDNLFIVSGSGDVIEPEAGVCAIGSGGNYALAAARALAENTEFPACEIVKKSLILAAKLCVFTNDNLTIEVIEQDTAKPTNAD